MRLYEVQEILVVLLLLAASAVTVFVFAVAFILFQEGIRRTLLWAKTRVARLPGLGSQGAVSKEPIAVCLPLKASKSGLPD
jgi:hypothetical protein